MTAGFQHVVYVLASWPAALLLRSSSLESASLEFNSPKPFAHAHRVAPPRPSAVSAAFTKGTPLFCSGEGGHGGGAKENAEETAHNVRVSRFGWQSPSFVSRRDSPMLKMR